MSVTPSDRELLELAAKAEGHGVEFDEASGLTWMDTKVTGMLWNPLTDDGDALRLAVKCLDFHILQYSREDWEHCGEDGYAATRRAIVRAAAEIGKTM